MAEMAVELVAVDRRIWSGNAGFVFARTVAGEIGILPRHTPLVAQLVDDASVRIDDTEGQSFTFAVDGGFLSVTEQGVTILVGNAEPAEDIDADAAAEDARSDDESVSAWGRARLRALGKTV
ncbi:F0F1 ATP synthase subunit epsilon [Smaragdicoccus niigatensis]|uniref:F0F1 ATP synthase subunit epsilon n=1 Tax=Smaragdicoccus niigatensis TaxID=359359 RepID=UPI00036A2542|nr:F0F1 ATP synthase subunit epsilon [Smaragdicoccus niigatensis]